MFGPIDQTVNVGNGPRSVATADFNGDSRLDLAVANSQSDNVTILLGNGLGGFSPATGSPVAVGNSPLSVAVGDFNRDGRPDLATVNFSSNNVSILLGNGTGGFSPAAGSPVAVGTGPRSVAVGDFNGDGRPDLAVGNGTSDNVTILLGNGTGGFSPAAGSPVAVGDFPESIAVGDFSGDGRIDLAVGNGTSHDMTILLGNGGGGFSPVAGSPITTAFGPNYMEVGDFNGDGKLDLAVGHGQLSILLGTGGGHFSEAVGSPINLGNSNSSVAVSDFNGDGISDLSVALGNGIAVLLGTGAGRFNLTPGSPFAISQIPDDVVAGDFNNDGLPDFASVNSRADNVTILLNHGGTSTTLLLSSPIAVFGQVVTFTAVVRSSGPAASGEVPTGTVTFTVDGNVVGQIGLSGGVANISFPSFGVGTHLVTATFTSDAFVSSTSSTLTQKVSQAATTTTLFGPATPPAAGQHTTLAAVVTGVDAAALTGLVTFLEAGLYSASPRSPMGAATLPVTFTTTGTHLILAQLSGDANFLGSSSAIVPVEVVGSAHKLVVGSGAGGQPLVKVFNTDGRSTARSSRLVRHSGVEFTWRRAT